VAADCPDARHATIDMPQSGMHQHFRHDQVLVSGALETRDCNGHAQKNRDAIEMSN
jgi:hypothetical protein